MNQEQTNITTGKQIRHLRTQLGMTQEELAGELNVTRQALSNWERDVNEPDLNMLKKICFLFGVNMDDFAKEVITKMETYEKKEKRQFKENPLSRLPIIHKEDLRNQHIITGHYDGIAQPFKDALPSYAGIEELDNAYNTETRFQSYYRDVLTIIHSSWANNFKPYFHVGPSDIDAGNIGIYCAKSPSKGVKTLVKLLADI